jgi:hypothetical protein
MPYRDPVEALRARNEALEREVRDLRGALARRERSPLDARRRRRFGMRLPIALFAVGLLGVLASNGLPHEAPMEATARTEPAPLPTGPALPPAPTTLPATGPSRSRDFVARAVHRFEGKVTKSMGRTPVEVNDTCNVSVHVFDAGSCLLSVSCGGWSISRGIDICSIDDQGFPRAKDRPLTHGFPDVRVDGARFELADTRPDRDYFIAMRLERAPPR